MGLRFTSRPKFGPFVLNFGAKGLTSVSLRLFGTSTRIWSATGKKNGLTSVDLPGPFSYRPGNKR